jgi:LPS-assembly lipoprotein
MKLSAKSLGYILLPLILLIAGCGFHLRGMAPIPHSLRNLYVDISQDNTGFIPQFNALATSNDITLANSVQTANAILKIISVSAPDPQLIAVTGSGQAGQYNLYYSVTFSVVKPDGIVLIQPTTLSQTRNFSSNASQALSANNQIQQLTQNMQQVIAQSIINQLAQVGS